MLFVRDVTEKKKMQAQLLQAEKLTLMGRLAAGIAHEIRNPLAAVTLNLQYLVGKLGVDPELRQTLDDMLEGARRIETVIGNTLNLARVAPPVLELNQLNGLIDQVLRYVKIALQHKRITIEARLDRNIPPVSADARQIQQVMINVLQNAIDASPEGSMLTVTTGIVTEPRPDAIQGMLRKAVVEIRDRGAGIPPESVKQIFESFRTTKAGGTGLGLALSKFIMDRHNAEIRIEPAVGGGTTVKLVFPIQG
jgi:signal transduction histidine kinase